MLQTMIIKADGSIESVRPKNGKTFELEELQSVVNGYIEIHRIDSHKAFLVLNEEGKLMGLPINEVATRIFLEEYRSSNDLIVGDVLIAQYSEID